MDPMTILTAATAVKDLLSGPGAPPPPAPGNMPGGMKTSDAISQLLGQTVNPNPVNQKVKGTFADPNMPPEMAQALMKAKSPKDTPHNKTLQEAAMAQLKPVDAMSTKDLKPIKGAKSKKGGGFLGGMDDFEKAALAMSLTSSLFQPPPAPAPPGLPGMPSANMRPTF